MRIKTATSQSLAYVIWVGTWYQPKRIDIQNDCQKANEENTATKEIGSIRKEDRTIRYEPSNYSYSS
jgi:hypothetical protein